MITVVAALIEKDNKILIAKRSTGDSSVLGKTNNSFIWFPKRKPAPVFGKKTGAGKMDLLMQGFAQNGHDQKSHAAADEGSQQLGPAEGGGKGFQHGSLHGAGGQQAFGQDTTDQPNHDGIQ